MNKELLADLALKEGARYMAQAGMNWSHDEAVRIGVGAVVDAITPFIESAYDEGYSDGLDGHEIDMTCRDMDWSLGVHSTITEMLK